MTKPFAPPEHTQFSNEAIDVIMREVSPNTWKIITVAIRKTYGWHKQRDRISYSQFMKLTGIKSKGTLSSALKEALEKGILLRYEAGDSFEYELNREYVVQKSNQYKNCTDTSTETVPLNAETGTETVHTKESIKEKKDNSLSDSEFWEKKKADKKTTPKEERKPLHIGGLESAILSERKFTKEDQAITAGDTIDSRLSNWPQDTVTEIVRAFANAYGKMPPPAPQHKKEKAPHYYAWRAGAETLLNTPGKGNVIHIINSLGQEYDGWEGIVQPGSIAKKVYAEMNKVTDAVVKPVNNISIHI